MFSWEASLSNELYFVRQYFYSGNYTKLFEIDTTSMSEKGLELTEIYMARAKLALGESLESIQSILTQKTPGSAAILALAGEGNMELIIDQHGNSDSVVQTLGAIFQIKNGSFDDAMDLLKKSVENLEAVALQVYIHLREHKIEAAEQTLKQALDWADEEIVLQLAQSWIKIVSGGVESYNDAFYVFEELNGTDSNPMTLTGMACADICLLRPEEALSSLKTALDSQPNYEEALSNMTTAITDLGPDAPSQAKNILSSFTNSSTLKLNDHLNEKAQEFDTFSTQFLSTA
ncbi:coatomer epsilon subunit [Schizosaccharomyces pombe]|uniref:Probable coatomer subunit epsilon n=1 Tax=Schizosaccharomyces pombe (strain 972 / ATCC 24843) TaxID=284812 RepID=COPE_SCHPO|nr:putative coatomer epsilon subunit protein [Schizosaccharomyces pombe]O74767.1 RecName: Full=Probable coatomer subunit epsilon; AltName: Full=Epsilon-coat protein; Short=Epsilon-COP [Schizosaccharomyces pombe 972h-]CAA21149.1 coatomer epsilon subunit (predicted) [Schizosaccharomyces pombe]|eukprot:NP_595959.1 putative coatomer epsilon subunit protein [Schizosaccharomyces pombe]